jgi:hypothetical protein
VKESSPQKTNIVVLFVGHLQNKQIHTDKNLISGGLGSVNEGGRWDPDWYSIFSRGDEHILNLNCSYGCMTL